MHFYSFSRFAEQPVRLKKISSMKVLFDSVSSVWKRTSFLRRFGLGISSSYSSTFSFSSLLLFQEL